MPFKKNYTYDKSESSYSDLLKELDTGKVQSILFYPRRREVDVIFKNGDKEKIPILYNDQLILEKASENKVELTINNSKKDSSLANSASSLIILFIFIFSFFNYFARHIRSTNSYQYAFISLCNESSFNSVYYFDNSYLCESSFNK